VFKKVSLILCPRIAFVDIFLPGISGLEFVDKMRGYPSVRVILLASRKQEYPSHHDTHGLLILDKGDTKGILEGIET
jgi:CheY-like chemotaxis protein